jgi:protein O-GlcNAc transferase
MKKVISYSLWGDKPMYNVGAVENADNASELYPDWICRYYVGESVPHETLEKLASRSNTELIMVKASNDWTGMFWRFFAVDSADVVLFRDVDSRLTLREKTAVNEWASSGKPIHIMRDHPYHTERIMGGMWGVICKPFMSLVEERIGCGNTDFMSIIQDWTQRANVTLNEKGIDQTFLRLIYSLTADVSFIHDQFPNFHAHSNRHPTQPVTDATKREFSTGFPSSYQNRNDFVGQVYDENNIPTKEFADLLVEKLKLIDSDLHL